MHNVQVLRHQETQINYPSTGSSSAIHFFQFSHGSRSQPSTSLHTDQQFLSLSQNHQIFSLTSLSLSLGDSRNPCQIYHQIRFMSRYVRIPPPSPLCLVTLL
ncbi:hypothetical protein Hanom_Chr06g00534181 [Helianthus anomalus]